MLGYSRENNGKTDFDNRNQQLCWDFIQTVYREKNGNMPLEDRWHVTFVSVRNSEWKKMDFSKYDTILHVAAIVHQKEQPEMEALYYAVNTKLTEELADKAKAERARQFVFKYDECLWNDNGTDYRRNRMYTDYFLWKKQACRRTVLM